MGFWTFLWYMKYLMFQLRNHNWASHSNWKETSPTLSFWMFVNRGKNIASNPGIWVAPHCHRSRENLTLVYWDIVLPPQPLTFSVSIVANMLLVATTVAAYMFGVGTFFFFGCQDFPGEAFSLYGDLVPTVATCICGAGTISFGCQNFLGETFYLYGELVLPLFHVNGILLE